MSTLHQAPESKLTTQVSSSKKVLAGSKAAMAALVASLAVTSPQTTNAQNPWNHEAHTTEVVTTPSAKPQAKTANFSDYRCDTKEKAEKEEIPDHFAEAEDIMYKYYPNYQKHFDEVFRKIASINASDKALMNRKIHEFLSDYNEIVITNEEERMIALLGFCEAITGTWKFHQEQLTFSEELKDMVKDFFKELSDEMRAKNEFLDVLVAESNQKVAESRKKIEELDKKILEVDKQIEQKDQQIAETLKELEKSMEWFLEERRLAEEMIITFELEDFLKDEVKQGYVKAYVRYSRKYSLTVLPKAEALLLALKEKK